MNVSGGIVSENNRYFLHLRIANEKKSQRSIVPSDVKHIDDLFTVAAQEIFEVTGLPSVLVAFHPTKNALETELIPYGGGATYGEIDGNLTLWKEGSIKF